MKDLFFSKLLHAEVQTHIFHLQIQDYAAHVAIGSFYDEIQDLNDSLIESCQGAHDVIVTNYELDPIINLQTSSKLNVANVQMIIGYLEELKMFLNENRLQVFSETDTDLLNLLDEIIGLINATLYKLKFLK